MSAPANDVNPHFFYFNLWSLEIFERDFDNLKTPNQVKIPDANKPENIESFTKTGYGVPENSSEVKTLKSESIITNSQENLYETEKSENLSYGRIKARRFQQLCGPLSRRPLLVHIVIEWPQMKTQPSIFN